MIVLRVAALLINAALAAWFAAHSRWTLAILWLIAVVFGCLVYRDRRAH